MLLIFRKCFDAFGPIFEVDEPADEYDFECAAITNPLILNTIYLQLKDNGTSF
jgi:hypothetical protein